MRAYIHISKSERKFYCDYNRLKNHLNQKQNTWTIMKK